MTDAYGKVARVAARLAADDDPDAQEVAEALAGRIAGEINDIFEYWYEPRRGLSPRDQAVRDQRDRWLREASPILIPGPPTHACARALAQRLARYHTDAWLPRDREKDKNPYRRDELSWFFFEVLSLVDHVLGEAQIWRIIDPNRHRPL